MKDKKNVPSLEEMNIKNEIEKCKKSPYYFATKSITIDVNAFNTIMSEHDFNNYINGLPVFKNLKCRS